MSEPYCESCRKCPHVGKDQMECYNGGRYDKCPWYKADIPYGESLMHD